MGQEYNAKVFAVHTPSILHGWWVLLVHSVLPTPHPPTLVCCKPVGFCQFVVAPGLCISLSFYVQVRKPEKLLLVLLLLVFFHRYESHIITVKYHFLDSFLFFTEERESHNCHTKQSFVKRESHNCHTKQSFLEREATIATQNNRS